MATWRAPTWRAPGGGMGGMDMYTHPLQVITALLVYRHKRAGFRFARSLLWCCIDGNFPITNRRGC